MIKLEFAVEEMIILVDLLDTAISDLRMEIRQTYNRDYRKMLQQRVILLKKLYTSITDRLPEQEPA
ncbi:MAG: hypothetical protein GX577_06655 [Leptolinea sp.]|nr:hypothetical protein [Leptolinea sp.]